MRWLGMLKAWDSPQRSFFWSFLCLWCFDRFFLSLVWWRRKKLRVVAGGWLMSSSSKLERCQKWIFEKQIWAFAAKVRKFFAKNNFLRSFCWKISKISWKRWFGLMLEKKHLRTKIFEIHGCQPFEWLDDVFFWSAYHHREDGVWWLPGPRAKGYIFTQGCTEIWGDAA